MRESNLGKKVIAISKCGAIAASIVLHSSNAFSDDAPKDPHKAAIENLAGQGYFKKAPCSAIASYVLSQHGLPEIGKTEPVNGKRGKFDRAKDREEPPKFSDNVTLNEKPLNWVGVEASSKLDIWSLTVERKMSLPDGGKKFSVEHTKTQYRFRVKKNEDSCQFVDLNYSFGAESKQDFSKTMNPDACVDTFVDPLPDPKTVPISTTLTLEILKKDCAIGLRYAHNLAPAADANK
jgi:hypothetical protein